MKLKQYVKAILSIFLFVYFLSALTSCADKKILARPDTWVVRDVVIGEYSFEELKLVITEDCEGAQSLIKVQGVDYAFNMYVNGELSVSTDEELDRQTYYRKELRAGFTWDDRVFALFGSLKEGKDGTYWDFSLGYGNSPLNKEYRVVGIKMNEI